MKVDSASVLICTYNRARLLSETLTALQEMTAPADCTMEILIVDNNSTDDTAAVVAACAERGPMPIVYAREPRQGKSFALNRGLARARGDVVALTDDDVVPARDWLKRIVDDFRQRDVTFVFGKVLPRWDTLPPPELLTPAAQIIWGPLAILDYGDRPADYVATRVDQQLPIGANLAFARRPIVAVGGWRTDLGKVNNTLISGEDHEIFLRLKRYGLYTGYYDPKVTTSHHVPATRLTRRYFRQWFFWHGKTQALMLDDLLRAQTLDIRRVPLVGGVPRFLYRQGLGQLCRYLKALWTCDALERLIEELHTLQYAGLFFDRWLSFFRRDGARGQGVPFGQRMRPDPVFGRATRDSMGGNS